MSFAPSVSLISEINIVHNISFLQWALYFAIVFLASEKNGKNKTGVEAATCFFSLHSGINKCIKETRAVQGWQKRKKTRKKYWEDTRKAAKKTKQNNRNSSFLRNNSFFTLQILLRTKEEGRKMRCKTLLTHFRTNPFLISVVRSIIFYIKGKIAFKR